MDSHSNPVETIELDIDNINIKNLRVITEEMNDDSSLQKNKNDNMHIDIKVKDNDMKDQDIQKQTQEVAQYRCCCKFCSISIIRVSFGRHLICWNSPQPIRDYISVICSLFCCVGCIIIIGGIFLAGFGGVYNTNNKRLDSMKSISSIFKGCHSYTDFDLSSRYNYECTWYFTPPEAGYQIHADLKLKVDNLQHMTADARDNLWKQLAAVNPIYYSSDDFDDISLDLNDRIKTVNKNWHDFIWTAKIFGGMCSIFIGLQTLMFLHCIVAAIPFCYCCRCKRDNIKNKKEKENKNNNHEIEVKRSS
jgi:hypothetical protein